MLLIEEVEETFDNEADEEGPALDSGFIVEDVEAKGAASNFK